MPGFSSSLTQVPPIDVVFAKNADFSGSATPNDTNGLQTNGQLWIGRTAVNAGGTHIDVATLTGGTGIIVTNGAGTITIAANGSVVGETITGDDSVALSPTGGNWNILGQDASVASVMDTNGSGSTLRIENRTWPTQFVVDSSTTVGLRGTYSTIQSAITAAAAVGTPAIVLVRAGTYTENITLSAGVDITGLGSGGSTPDVTIIGKLTGTFAGSCTISNVRLQTNADNVLAITGSEATIVNVEYCYINATNASAIALSSSGGCLVNLFRCIGNLGTTGINYFALTSSSSIRIFYCNLANSGGSTTQSSVATGCSLSMFFSFFSSPISSSGVASIGIAYTTVGSTATALTVNGTGTNTVQHSVIGGPAAVSAITVGAGALLTLTNSNITAATTNAIVGAGSISYASLTFDGTGNAITTTTQTQLVTGPNVTIGGSQTGVTNTLTISNASNTASSNALQQVTVAGTSAGDAFTTYTVSGTTNWSLGVDNSVTGDPFVVAASTALGTTNVMSVATTGEINYPLQPAFLAYLGTTDSNVTGDGTAYTLGTGNALTEIFDQNSDFNTNGTFTAPVTGRYRLSFNMTFQEIGALHTLGNYILSTSNRAYTATYLNVGAVQTGGFYCMSTSVLADMDVNDTATVLIAISGSTKTVDAYGVATFTYFSGSLDC